MFIKFYNWIMKRKMIMEKKFELQRYVITEKYFKNRIEVHGETQRRESLNQIQTLMEELKRQIEFFENL